jgi:hypothetical protein
MLSGKMQPSLTPPMRYRELDQATAFSLLKPGIGMMVLSLTPTPEEAIHNSVSEGSIQLDALH